LDTSAGETFQVKYGMYYGPAAGYIVKNLEKKREY